MTPGPIPIALFAAMLGAVLVQSAPQPHVAVSSDAAQWDRLPTPGEFASLYPQDALDQQAGARTAMTCQVQADGTLTGCAILEESPRRYGFGRATIAAAPFFRLKSPTPGGTTTEGRSVRISLTWSDR